MWTGRDHKFGGLKYRYVKRPRGDSRAFDPLRKEPVSFSTELKYENWLLHWAEPEVSGLTTSPERLRCLDRGQTVSITPDLLVIRAHVEIQCVVRSMHGNAIETEKSLERVAQAHGCLWTLRTREQIRANPLLLDNLERFRQSAMICVDEPLDELREKINAALPKNSTVSIGDLREAVKCEDGDSRLDALLIRMHWNKHVQINFKEFRYDDATVSSSAFCA
ncbi:hypothetical protein PQQ65_27370 [Paraburkholderia strydomiana]|uniref:hypothetical protein n=1 Tax=Paraburkholderia strydomiana TaxID=1245417 RepID=UPI0038BB500F